MTDPRIEFAAAFDNIDNTPGLTQMEKYRAKAKLEGMAASGLAITPDGRGVPRS